MFVVDGEQLGSGPAPVELLRTSLAQRGDAPYLGVLRGGRLDVYLLALGGTRKSNRVLLDLQPSSVDQTFPRLANLRPAIASRRNGWVSGVVLRLLNQSIGDLAKRGVSKNDAVSLVGRALFARFLGDRDLLPLDALGVADPSTLMDTPDRARLTCHWLDQTFNGDLLPIADATLAGLTSEQCGLLGNILRRAEPDGQLHLGWQERWDNLDFAHVPVGVLSQAYEQHLRVHASDRQRREGGFYTPPQVAQLMVKATIRALDRDDDVASPRLLDPAVGAGVFLIVALRELVGRQWVRSGVRPDTKEIRRILSSQLVGFDVNETALRFAALGLYLAAIELDPDPLPVDKLVFANLRGTVLHHVGHPIDDQRPHLGSLGPSVGPEHEGAYDIVLGNPPWSSATKLPDWKSVVERVSRITAERVGDHVKPRLPNAVLDLPFVWRAMEWAKPGGQIAFALHGRVLFQHGEGMFETRTALLSCLEAKSVINGADLRQTRFWPQISAPFCILFARNAVPGPGHAFRFLSPRVERDLNDAGIMRLDTLRSDTVTVSEVAAHHYTLKALYRSSRAGLALADRLTQGSYSSLAKYWASDDRSRYHGNGYQRLRPSSETKTRNGVAIEPPGVDATYLHDLPEFIGPARTIRVSATSLPPFGLERFHRRRPRELFTGPLLLVRQSPPVASGRIQLTLIDGSAVFNESYYGYSSQGISNAEELTRYLVVILGTRVALWLALTTSGKFGFERDVIEKTTIDAIPIPPYEDLTDGDKATAQQIFERLADDDKAAWTAADELAGRLYGLSQRDIDLIDDTLIYSSPFSHSRRGAQEATVKGDISRFCDTLNNELAPLAKRFGTKLRVHPIDEDPASPWRIVSIQAGNTPADEALHERVSEVLRGADELAATEVVLDFGATSLLLGRLNQRRYWTKTQARQLAQELFWSHLPALMDRAS